MKQLKLCIVLLMMMGCVDNIKNSQATHEVKMITGSTNNQLEILDWGGNGQPMLFLTGLTNSVHVYDSFALRFTDKYRVYGMSRRGYGKSEQTKDGYGIDTLANDILAVLNALKIDKVILIGHSIAGDEITTFATKYPDRVSHIIYLDAAYSHFKLPEAFPEFPRATAKDSLSVQNFNGYLKRVRGFTFPEDEIRNQYVFDTAGRIVENISSWSIAGAIVGGIKVPDYNSIKCPALAIYGERNTVQEWFPSFPLMDSVNQQIATNEFMPEWKKYYDAEINRFKNEKADGIVKEIPGADHYIFLTHPEATEKIIKEFLKK